MTHAPHRPGGLFVGLATLDIVQLVDAVPSANQKVVARDFAVAAGGPATNAAVAAAHLGTPSIVVTALPQHSLSDVITTELASVGVRVAAAASYDGPPVTASILVTSATGERAIVSPSGAASEQNPHPTATVPSLDGVGVVLIDGYFRAVAAPIVAAAGARGIPVILDGGSFKPHTPEVIPGATIAVLSEDFAPPAADGSRLREPDEVVAWCAKHGVQRVAITRGARSIVYVTPAGSGEVAVPAVAAVDTLGAGDVFHGALAHRIATHGADDARLPEDLAFAASVAARSVQHFGTRAWLTA